MASGKTTGFTRAIAEEAGAAEQVNQLMAAWEGDTDRGVPLDLTEVEHATKYGLDVRNKETASSLVARFRNAANEVLLTLIKEAVTIGKALTCSSTVTFNDDVIVAATKTVDGVDISAHVHTGAAGDGETIGAAGITNRTRQFLVPAVSGYNFTDATDLERNANEHGWLLVNNKQCNVVGDFLLPSNYVSGLTISAVTVPGASGSVYSYVYEKHGAVGEAYDTHSGDSTISATALTLDEIALIEEYTPASVTAGDHFIVGFQRDATNAADTVAASVGCRGWLISYTADS